MNKALIALSIPLFLWSCGTKSGSEKEDSTEKIELTTEEESAIVNDISTEIKTNIEEIKEVTEENLQEVDSLLENF